MTDSIQTYIVTRSHPSGGRYKVIREFAVYQEARQWADDANEGRKDEDPIYQVRFRS
jgi:hypothetical protein